MTILRILSKANVLLKDELDIKNLWVLANLDDVLAQALHGSTTL
jgi:hypothetical protein